MNDELLIKYLQKTASEDELEQVRQWLATDTDHRRLFELEEVYALKNRMHYAQPAVSEAAYRRLRHALHTQTPPASTHQKPFLPLRFGSLLVRYAATLILISLLSANLYFLTRSDETSAQLAYNTIQVPKGQRASVTLSDGTRVWLNAETELVYPAQFDPKQRQVNLRGEAYFEVSSSKNRPFIVHLPSLDVKVLGTKFNAKAYQGEDHCITLAQGAVEVSTKNGSQTEKMLPKDQVYFRKNGQMEHFQQTNAYHATDWITGSLRIDNQPLVEFLPDMERHYDVNIHLQDAAIRSLRFTCHFKNGVDIKEALDLLKATKQIDYIIDRKDVYLYKFHP